MQISTKLSDYDGTLIPTTLTHNTITKNREFPTNSYYKKL